MKLIALKNKIVEALGIVERITGTHSNLPILKNILLKAAENKIFVSATNLEFAVTHSFSGKIIEDGEVTVPAGLFSSLSRGLTSERVTIELKGSNLKVFTDNYEASLQTQDAKEFPIIPSISKDFHELSTSTNTFSEALVSVITAAQFSEIRPEISGVYIRENQGMLLVATDSFRLAERRVGMETKKKSKEIKCIIPIKAAEEMLRIFSNSSDEPLQILIDETQAFFKTQNTEIITRLIDGAFPDYEPIIPKETKTEVVLGRQEFLQAVKLVSAFSTKINDVRISVKEGEKHIEVSASNTGTGENTYRIPAKISGDPFEVAFNWHFLIDGIKSFKDDDIILGVNAGDKPVVIRGSADKNLIYVVMPLKI